MFAHSALSYTSITGGEQNGKGEREAGETDGQEKSRETYRGLCAEIRSYVCFFLRKRFFPEDGLLLATSPFCAVAASKLILDNRNRCSIHFGGKKQDKKLRASHLRWAARLSWEQP